MHERQLHAAKKRNSVCVRKTERRYLALAGVGIIRFGKRNICRGAAGAWGDAWSRGAASLSCPQMEAQIELVGLRKLNLLREPPHHYQPHTEFRVICFSWQIDFYILALVLCHPVLIFLSLTLLLVLILADVYSHVWWEEFIWTWWFTSVM